MYSKTSHNPVKKITACPLAGESWWLERMIAVIVDIIIFYHDGNEEPRLLWLWWYQPCRWFFEGKEATWVNQVATIFERYRQFHSLDGKSFNLRVFCLFLKPQGPINPDNHHHDVGHSSVSGFSVWSQSTKAWVCYSSGFGWLSSLWLQKQPTSLYSNEFRQLHLFYRARRWDVGLNQLQPPSPR